MKRTFIKACSFLFVLGLAAQSRAGTIIEGNANWYEFLFGPTQLSFAGDGSAAFPSTGGNSEAAPAAPWTFTSTYGGTITVTDAFQYGDTFAVIDNGDILHPLLITSSPSGSPTAYGCGGTFLDSTDPVNCLADPGMSSGSAVYGPGSHSLQIIASSANHGGEHPYGGAAYFRTDPVPEPASMLLFGTGALGLAARFRRRREQQP